MLTNKKGITPNNNQRYTNRGLYYGRCSGNIWNKYHAKRLTDNKGILVSEDFGIRVGITTYTVWNLGDGYCFEGPLSSRFIKDPTLDSIRFWW